MTSRLFLVAEPEFNKAEYMKTSALTYFLHHSRMRATSGLVDPNHFFCPMAFTLLSYELKYWPLKCRYLEQIFPNLAPRKDFTTGISALNTVKQSVAAVTALAIALQSSVALAASLRDAEEFHAIFRSTVSSVIGASKMPYVHMLPDENILRAEDADSIDSAIDAAKLASLVKLIDNTKNSTNSIRTIDADKILSKKPVTIVIVPGFLGEFIENRGFEEVFAPIDQAKLQEAAATDVERGSSTQVRDERTAEFFDKMTAAAQALGDGNSVDERNDKGQVVYSLKKPGIQAVPTSNTARRRAFFSLSSQCEFCLQNCRDSSSIFLYSELGCYLNQPPVKRRDFG
jgi:hypothetical protein